MAANSQSDTLLYDGFNMYEAHDWESIISKLNTSGINRRVVHDSVIYGNDPLSMAVASSDLWFCSHDIDPEAESAALMAAVATITSSVETLVTPQTTLVPLRHASSVSTTTSCGAMSHMSVGVNKEHRPSVVLGTVVRLTDNVPTNTYTNVIDRYDYCRVVWDTRHKTESGQS